MVGTIHHRIKYIAKFDSVFLRELPYLRGKQLALSWHVVVRGIMSAVYDLPECRLIHWNPQVLRPAGRPTASTCTSLTSSILTRRGQEPSPCRQECGPAAISGARRLRSRR